MDQTKNDKYLLLDKIFFLPGGGGAEGGVDHRSARVARGREGRHQGLFVLC